MTTHPDLFISPSALPGLDPVGLRVWNVRDELEGHVVPGVYQHLVYAPTEGDGNLHPLVDDPWMLDFADAETRDRVTRWALARVGDTAHGGARWRSCGRINGCPAWALHGDRPAYTTFGSRAWHEVPIDAVDPDDNTRLEDGSRLADARALVVVARHLGAL